MEKDPYGNIHYIKKCRKKEMCGKAKLITLEKNFSQFKVRCHEKGRIKTISFSGSDV